MAFAADGFPLIDAPGPGYREQSARLVEQRAPEKLEPISFMYPFMAPRASFDGRVPEQPLLPRGEFKLLYENEGWNFSVYDTPARAAYEAAKSKTDVAAPENPAPTAGEEAEPGKEAAEQEDVVRLPVIPEVILPVPRDVDPLDAGVQRFLEHLPLQLRHP